MKSMSQTLRLRWPRLADRGTADRVAAPAPARPEDPDLEPTIYRFIIRHSYRRQLVILAMTLVSFPFLYYSLSLPKTIINRAIGGHKFPQDFLLWQLDQIPYLVG